MRVAIGDVVRVREDGALGTVVSIAGYGGEMIHIHTDGRGSRMLTPEDLEHVAQARKSFTTTRLVLALISLAAIFIAALLIGSLVHELGGGSVLALFVGFASGHTLATLLAKLLLRPRAVRI